jgi:Raf kinase inhibitor-like YbhB/YbcL family protein
MAVVMLSSCRGKPSSDSVLPADPKRVIIGLTSPAFADGGAIPKVYTCDGRDVSPPLKWSGAPESARSLAVICEDPDAPAGTWTHWVLFKLPARVEELPEGIPPQEHVTLKPGAEAAQGRNDSGKVGYGGPCPRSGRHRYVFRLFALDTPLDPGKPISRESLLQSMRGHVVAEGRLTGTYAR